MDYHPIIIVLLAFAIYWMLVYVLDRKGVLEEHNITAYGPLLMIRTLRGQRFLESAARPKRFWRVFADIGIPATVISMLFMFIMVLFVDYMVLRYTPQPSKLTEPSSLLLLPGINPFIPLVWGLFGLIVTIVVHELSHAILCRVEGIDVKSMGLLIAFIPLGAFAEPDEEQLFGPKDKDAEAKLDVKIASRRSRLRVLSAGVMANFVVALIFFMLFFGPVLGSIQPSHYDSSVVVFGVVEGSPADVAGMRENMIITGVDSTSISNLTEFHEYVNGTTQEQMVTVHVVDGNTNRSLKMEGGYLPGVGVLDVTAAYPADEAGVKPGMLLIGIDEKKINVSADFYEFMHYTYPDQQVTLSLMRNGIPIHIPVKLTKSPYPDASNGFLGVVTVDTPGGTMAAGFPAATYLDLLRNTPHRLFFGGGAITLMELLRIFSFPFISFIEGGFNSFSHPLTYFYQPTEWASILGDGVFWIANAVFWIAWINLIAGLFNCLPAIPLDGGHVFTDMARYMMKPFTSNRERQEQLASAIVNYFAILIFLSILITVTLPYIVYGLLPYIVQQLG